MKKLGLVALIEASFFAAFAVILDLLPSIKLTPAISISIAMVPIFILSLRWGWKAGFISGFLWGILQIVMGDAWIVTPLQTFIEYFVAFAFIGCAGFLALTIQKSLAEGKKGKALGLAAAAIFLGSAGRYFWHFFAGMIFFGSYAPEGMSPFVYSLMINGITMLGSAVLCTAVLWLLLSAAPRLIQRKQGYSAAEEHKLAN
ncbi:energy-coupled thiamine transporter ThiT [Bacillus infantis]|uniref:energy-coupled thiamine transporter ThiT n=1 Tax=Bacillus infantis TaxID=324767 RepID=UPI00344E58B1